MMLDGSFNAIFPMTCVVAAGLASMIAEAFRDPDEQQPIGALAVIGLLGAGIVSVLLWDRQAASFGVVSADNFGLFITLILVVVGLVTVVLSSQVAARERLPNGDYYALLLFSIGGMILMAMATDLLVIFLSLEMLSLAVYVLTGIRRVLMVHGDTLGGPTFATCVLVLTVFSVVMYTIALWVLGRTLDYGRRIGVLSGY